MDNQHVESHRANAKKDMGVVMPRAKDELRRRTSHSLDVRAAGKGFALVRPGAGRFEREMKERGLKTWTN